MVNRENILFFAAAFTFGLAAILMRDAGSFGWLVPAGLSAFAAAHLP